MAEGSYFEFYRKRSKRFARLYRDLPLYTKPVICAVKGVALGGGLELALVADIIVAGRNAKFGFPETGIGIGIMPGAGGTQTLPRLIGKALAKELIWTGRRLSADEALAMRLVNHVVDAGAALERSRDMARTIAQKAPIAVMQSKAAIERGSGSDLSLADGMALESDAAFLLYFTQDRREGLAAFREKRPAQFKGA